MAEQQNYPAAIELAHRRATGKSGPLLIDKLRPKTFDEAFALQQAVGKIFAGVTANEVEGWKCSLPSEEKKIVASLYAPTIQHQVNGTSSLCKLHPNTDSLAVVEPELAFQLKHDLPARASNYSKDEVDAAIATTRLALELIQSRYDAPQQASFFDALADGLLNQGVWLGPELSINSTQNLTEFLLKIQFADGKIETKQARHPNGNPRAGLYWLVNFLSAQGIGLRAGQQVITGSYAGVLKLPLGQLISLRYGELGEFSIQFERQ